MVAYFVLGVKYENVMMWEKRTDDKEELTSMLRAYQVAADSILSVYPKCDATVTKYINMWAYTSTYNSFISLPNILGVRPDALPVKGEEVMDKPYRVVDNPLGVVFPIVPSLVANFLPRQASLKEQMDSLYANYTCSELTTKVCEAVMDKYLSRFDYENKFEEGLAELQEVTQKHGLDKKYVNTFKANRSTVKGSPFPASVKLVDADGKEMDFAQFRGKYVYIDMWASWCVPCCREVPHLQKLESELESDDVVFLSISIDKNKLAEITSGLSGADISKVCNDAAFTATVADEETVKFSYFEQAVVNVRKGLEDKSMEMGTIKFCALRQWIMSGRRASIAHLTCSSKHSICSRSYSRLQ